MLRNGTPERSAPARPDSATRRRANRAGSSTARQRPEASVWMCSDFAQILQDVDTGQRAATGWCACDPRAVKKHPAYDIGERWPK